MTEIDVVILIDENGDYAVHHDPDAIKERFEEEVGELDGALAYRLVKLKVKVPTPAAAIATITVPPLPSDAAVTLHAPKFITPGEADDADTDVVEPA